MWPSNYIYIVNAFNDASPNNKYHKEKIQETHTKLSQGVIKPTQFIYICEASMKYDYISS